MLLLEAHACATPINFKEPCVTTCFYSQETNGNPISPALPTTRLVNIRPNQLHIIIIDHSLTKGGPFLVTKVADGIKEGNLFNLWQ